jgi:hypothetical protein
MTPTTPPMLARYRECKRIVPSRDWSEDMGRFVAICANDNLRIWQAADGTYRHDKSEVKQLAAFERGEGIDWSIR